jgi:hypothetical protein
LQWSCSPKSILISVAIFLSHSLFYMLVLLRKGGEKLDINRRWLYLQIFVLLCLYSNHSIFVRRRIFVSPE